MRRWSVLIAIMLALMLLAGTSGCGGSDLTSLQQPQEMVQTILDASENVNSGTATVEGQIQLNFLPDELAPEDLGFAGMLSGPVTVEGTIAFSGEQTADVDMTIGAAGVTFNMGIRAVDEQAWVYALGQWYDLTEAMEDLGYGKGPGSWGQAYDAEQIEKVVSDLGIDPVEWLGDVDLVGEENLAGVPVYHLTCSPDVVLLMNDVFRLLQSQEFMTTIDPTGELFDLMGSDFPAPAELAEVQTMLPQMFKQLTLDFWAAKSDAIARQMKAYMEIGPPPGEDTEGLESIEIALAVWLDNINQPVKVQAPETYLPFSAFEDMLGGGSDLMPFMGGDSGSGGLFEF